MNNKNISLHDYYLKIKNNNTVKKNNDFLFNLVYKILYKRFNNKL